MHQVVPLKIVTVSCYADLTSVSYLKQKKTRPRFFCRLRGGRLGERQLRLSGTGGPGGSPGQVWRREAIPRRPPARPAGEAPWREASPADPAGPGPAARRAWGPRLQLALSPGEEASVHFPGQAAAFSLRGGLPLCPPRAGHGATARLPDRTRARSPRSRAGTPLPPLLCRSPELSEPLGSSGRPGPARQRPLQAAWRCTGTLAAASRAVLPRAEPGQGVTVERQTPCSVCAEHVGQTSMPRRPALDPQKPHQWAPPSRLPVSRAQAKAAPSGAQTPAALSRGTDALPGLRSEGRAEGFSRCQETEDGGAAEAPLSRQGVRGGGLQAATPRPHGAAFCCIRCALFCPNF